MAGAPQQLLGVVVSIPHQKLLDFKGFRTTLGLLLDYFPSGQIWSRTTAQSDHDYEKNDRDYDKNDPDYNSQGKPPKYEQKVVQDYSWTELGHALAGKTSSPVSPPHKNGVVLACGHR